MERRLAAILAADVVGYSALMEKDEAGTFARLKARRQELVEPEIANHHGRIFKLMGDGLMAEFGSVVDAVECAVALQRGLAERNESVPEENRIRLRIGINLGEVIVEGDDRYGEGVNVAARLEQLADPGGVFVSAKVAREVEKKLAFGFEPMGEQRVKNMTEPLTVYRVILDGAPPSVRLAPSLPRTNRPRALAVGWIAIVLIAIGAFLGYQRWSEPNGPPLPDKPSIAVLPFVNMSNDPEQAYFADGISEDLMTDLSHVSGLFVIARNSVFAYKGKAIDVRKVAKELGVRYVIEGSVRRAGDQVRINVQLIDATTGAHQWAERYDGSYGNIFALQDKVTKAVVDAMALKLTAGENLALAQRETKNPEAYDAFLRGWEHYGRTTPESFIKAIPYFERAIELDPEYGRAYAALAMVYFRSYDNRWSGNLGMPEAEVYRKAQEFARLAKKFPTSTYHQVAGGISRARGWYNDALQEFAAAIALDPSDSWNHAELAYALIYAGRPQEAAAEIETAMRLDPRFPPLFVYYKGLTEFAQDRWPEAARLFEEATRLNPDDPRPRLFLAAAHGKLGRTEDADAVIAEFSAARVRLGGLPFVMVEFVGEVHPAHLNPPERSRLMEGLDRANIPRTFDDAIFDKLRLSSGEIDALFLGHRVHGRLLETGREYGAIVSPDRAAQRFGDWGTVSGTVQIEGNRLCFVSASTSYYCGSVLRNPGGTRAKENEFIWFAVDGYGLPFSQIE